MAGNKEVSPEGKSIDTPLGSSQPNEQVKELSRSIEKPLPPDKIATTAEQEKLDSAAFLKKWLIEAIGEAKNRCHEPYCEPESSGAPPPPGEERAPQPPDSPEEQRPPPFVFPEKIEEFAACLASWLVETPAIWDEFYWPERNAEPQQQPSSPTTQPHADQDRTASAKPASPDVASVIGEVEDQLEALLRAQSQSRQKAADKAPASDAKPAEAKKTTASDEAPETAPNEDAALEGEVLGPEEEGMTEDDADHPSGLLEALQRLRAVVEAGDQTEAGEEYGNGGDGGALPDTFQGGHEEVAIQGLMALKPYPGNARRALRVAKGPLANAMQRLAFEGHSPEHMVDVIIHVFAGEKVYASGDSRPACSPQFLEFMARLRALLATQPAEERSASFMETQTNLVTWYGGTGARRCQVCAVDLGLEVLHDGLTSEWSRGGRVPVERYVHLLANNLAGWLDDLIPFKGDEDRRRGDRARSLNAIHAVASVAHLRRDRNDDKRDKEKAAAVLKAFGLDESHFGEQPQRLAQALAFMSRVQPAWRLLCGEFAPMQEYFTPLPDAPGIHTEGNHPRYLTAIMAALAAPLRAALASREDSDEAVSALFNLGVDLVRHAKATGNPSSVNPIRILCNGLGLWWALLRAESDEQAIVEFHGGSCAVNLFGALTESECVRTEAIQGVLRPLGQALHALIRGHEKPADAERLRNSYQELFGKEASIAPLRTQRTQIQTWLLAVLHACLADRLKLGTTPIAPLLDEQTFPETLAHWLNLAFEAEADDRIRDEHRREAEKLGRDSTSLRSAIDKLNNHIGTLSQLHPDTSGPEVVEASGVASESYEEKTETQRAPHQKQLSTVATDANNLIALINSHTPPEKHIEKIDVEDILEDAEESSLLILEKLRVTAIAAEAVLEHVERMKNLYHQPVGTSDSAIPGLTEKEIKQAKTNYHEVRLGWIKVASKLVSVAEHPETGYGGLPDFIRYSLADWGVAEGCDSKPNTDSPPPDSDALASLLRNERIMSGMLGLKSQGKR